MARKETAAKKDAKEKEQDMPPIPKGYEEVGDYWEKMFAFESKGDFISGIYRGSVGKIGENESNVHIFEVDGERIGVWGSAVLDKRMTSVKHDADVMIVLEGREVSEATGRMYKDFKVYQKKGTGESRQRTKDDIPF